MAADRHDDDRHGDIGHGDLARVDLSALDPTRAEAHLDSAVAEIMEEARFELARRAASTRGMPGLPRLWGRVVWPAAAAIALVSIGMLRTGETAIAATPDEEMALAVGVPEALAPWVGQTDSPGLSEILVGWNEEDGR